MNACCYFCCNFSSGFLFIEGRILSFWNFSLTLILSSDGQPFLCPAHFDGHPLPKPHTAYSIWYFQKISITHRLAITDVIDKVYFRPIGFLLWLKLLWLMVVCGRHSTLCGDLILMNVKEWLWCFISGVWSCLCSGKSGKLQLLVKI